ncbi:M60 family metallopeptidase [Blastopirellula sp. JC732]|uniref:M60 family metallopeptidase n=1 Tax=Blastopirellula sediminis TaxID=2894196 RepID=A0A9X1SMH5_9BACT|nr:M60 family metallopeptidase [Blastopirellula sediminis]MCC9605006.1 M60 family metallopeptidase [Blastopirellula sediminis]MCC9631694.1 M60 family metallopeptidase [Blastopirellula sediminis]
MLRFAGLLAALLCCHGLTSSTLAANANEKLTPTLQKATRDEKLTAEEFLAVKKALIAEAKRSTPSSKEMTDLIEKLREAPAAKIGPDRKNHLKVLDNTLVSLRAIYEGELAGQVLPPAKLQKHPSADLFPGAIESQIRFATHNCEINVNAYRWQSTGLYAPPGVVIRVTIPEEFVGAGWKVRIGCNSTTIDAPKHLTLKRFPDIDRVYDLSKGTTPIASSFGGLIYIELPLPKAKEYLGRDSDIYNLVDSYDPPAPQLCTVQMTNVIQAPRYVHGVTNVGEWRAQIRNYPAPYAEIGSGKVIFMIPSHFVREFDTPDLMMNKWDQVIDAMSELSGRPKTKPFPHRVLIEPHINAGAAFASYPINVPYGWASDILKGEPGWGMGHELGHLHQHRSWTYQGCGEVTVNIFAIYSLTKVNGSVPDRGTREKAIADARKYLSKPLAERSWMTVKGELFERLAFYTILETELGWEPFQQVFREYRRLPLDQHLKSDVDRASDFMIRMSKATNKDLGPYFVQWGVQVNDEALQKTKSYPAWESEMVRETLKQ